MSIATSTLQQPLQRPARRRWLARASARLWLVLCATAAGGVLASGGAAAAEPVPADGKVSQSPPPGSDEARAEELLERGVGLRRDDRDTEALVFFRQALELAPDSSRALAHLGTTYQALGRWVLADDFLSKALEHGSDPYVRRHRPALEQAREFVRDHLGLLEVIGGPAGAEVLLNGQRIGTLPLSEPVRVPVGAYQMEVSLAGHYGVNQPVRISRRALTRELVELLPLSSGSRDEAVSTAAAGGAPIAGRVQTPGLEPSEGAGWLPWTLAGAGVAAAGVSTVALIQRQRHAERWNDDGECLNVPGATRRSSCGRERTLGKRWQTAAIVSGGAAVALGTAALWTVLSDSDEPAETRVGVQSCTFGVAEVSCSGRF